MFVIWNLLGNIGNFTISSNTFKPRKNKGFIKTKVLVLLFCDINYSITNVSIFDSVVYIISCKSEQKSACFEKHFKGVVYIWDRLTIRFVYCAQFCSEWWCPEPSLLLAGNLFSGSGLFHLIIPTHKNTPSGPCLSRIVNKGEGILMCRPTAGRKFRPFWRLNCC